MPISRIGTDGIEAGAVAISDLSATGTPSSTTFLRGDNTWSSTMTSGTAVTLTNQTNVDFTGIPSGVKRITVVYNAVSTNGSSNYLVQLGDSGGIETTSYQASSREGTIVNYYTTGFGVATASSVNICWGHMVLTNISGNIWVSSHTVGFTQAGNGYVCSGGGVKTTSDTLDRLRITTVNGTDQFDAGTINIMWE